MIIYIILIIIIYFLFTYKTEQFVGDNKCNTKIKLKGTENIDHHINKLNTEQGNKIILNPNDLMAYNSSNSYEYNILNNYGIKYTKKFNNYKLMQQKCNTIPYNSRLYFNKYDNVLNNSFISNSNKSIKPIYIINKDYTLYWSYTMNKNNWFKFYYKINGNLKTFHIDKDNINCKDFSLKIYNYKDNRNMYRLTFKNKKHKISSYLVLYAGSKSLVKSNKIKINY